MKISIDLRPFPPPVRADYWAGLVGDELFIIDSDLGERSVTNDLEAVLLEIWRKLIPPDQDMPELKIRYRDSMGEWDRIVVERLVGFDGSFSAEIVSGRNEPPPNSWTLQAAANASSIGAEVVQ